jgi:hypothetical protein
MAQTQYAVGWGTLALLNAGIAQAQRRSGWNWFVASLFLGPIATLLIVLWYRRPATPAADDERAGAAE